MKRPINKGKTRHRYPPSPTPACRQAGRRRASPWLSLERFHALGLRMAGFLHQFKTPLHVIQSQAECLLDERGLSEPVRASLQLILQNAGRLSAQTQKILDLSRGNRLDLREATVQPLLDEICQMAQLDCRRKNVTLQIDLMATSPIQMDSTALQGALHNLVNNALEATPDGGVIKLKTYETPDLKRVAVQIEDTGPGLDRQALRRIRSPYQTSKSNGHGLGLYITRHILRRHKASFYLESRPGEGTKATVLFPVVNPAPVRGGVKKR